MPSLAHDTADSPENARVSRAYERNYELLCHIASGKFHIPEQDVSGIIHDAFIAFIRNAYRIGCTDADERSWLVGTVCNGCRYYWRKTRREAWVGDDLTQVLDPKSVAEAAHARIAVTKLLRQLPARCREILRDRFSEGYSSRDIAGRAAIAYGTAKNLISKCLGAARAAYESDRSR